MWRLAMLVAIPKRAATLRFMSAKSSSRRAGDDWLVAGPFGGKAGVKSIERTNEREEPTRRWWCEGFGYVKTSSSEPSQAGLRS
uniref:Putative secreted protein n=1 Tax=Anopheles triannulatus TaxID=58253 RepID=A0A2M4B7L7_9DIPT